MQLKRVPNVLRAAAECPECGSQRFYHVSRKHYCDQCGMIITEG